MNTIDHFKRIRSLCGSLECVLDALDLVEDKSQCSGTARFLMTELKDAIEAFENTVNPRMDEPAND